MQEILQNHDTALVVDHCEVQLWISDKEGGWRVLHTEYQIANNASAGYAVEIEGMRSIIMRQVFHLLINLLVLV